MVLSTGFPRAPLGIESKIHWQTVSQSQEGQAWRPCKAALCSQTVGADSGLGLACLPTSQHPPPSPAGCWVLRAAPPASKGGLQHGLGSELGPLTPSKHTLAKLLHPHCPLHPALKVQFPVLSTGDPPSTPLQLPPALQTHATLFSTLLWPLPLHSHSSSSPKTPRLDGVTRGEFPLREPKYWLAWNPGSVAMQLFTQLRKRPWPDPHSSCQAEQSWERVAGVGGAD